MISTQHQLDSLIDSLAGQPVLAIDCEMDAMFAYRTSLCVVQIGWDGGEALIDAMVELDRSGLGRLCADPDVVKVFHGGENDVGLMAGHWDMRFENVFDTMAASQVLGHDGVGLAALLLRHFDVKISKKFQKADWRVRPLPAEQAEYARLDVRYLLTLRENLLAELQELGRVEEAESEFRRIGAARMEDKPFDPDSWARLKGVRDLPAEHRGALRAVFIARDAIARKLDRAPYRVLQESTMLELARRQPDSVSAIKRMRGIGRQLGNGELEQLLKAVRNGSKEKAQALPRRPRVRPGSEGGAPLSPDQTTLYDALRAWRAKRAETRGVGVARVATNQLLGAIARRWPASLDELSGVRGMEPWRMREYGEEIVAIVLDGNSQEGGSGE